MTINNLHGGEGLLNASMIIVILYSDKVIDIPMF